jgi:hypothetical protein
MDQSDILIQRGGVNRELNISGTQVLVALAASFALAAPLVWALVRYWLFAP